MPDQPLQGGHNIIWDNGIPSTHYVQPVTDDTIKESLRKALSKEYTPTPDALGEVPASELKYAGWSRLDVMNDRVVEQATLGDLEAYKQVMDRTVGKPKQTIEQTGTVQLTFQQWIDQRLEQNPNFLLPSTEVRISDERRYGADVVDAEVAAEQEPSVYDAINYESLTGF